MKATEAKLLDFLKKSPQFIVPIYQRTYSWEEKHCQQLWDDIIRSGSNDQVTAHFVGSIVYIEKDLYQVVNQPPLLIIDGQQRLTTISLLIEALARVLGEDEPVEGFTTRKLRHYYLLNPEESGEKYYKLILSQTDKDSLIALLENRDYPANTSKRIQQNFEFFMNQLRNTSTDLCVVCKGLTKLIIVDISLTRGHDNPQLIFESLNSTGLELSQADLIRNYILMGLEQELQTKLYETYWRAMEKDFGQEAYIEYFDRFMRDYLTIKTGEIPNLRSVYESFKRYAASQVNLGVEALVADIRRFAGYYCNMVLGAETDKELNQVFQDIHELKVDVAYPLLLEFYDDYKKQSLLKDDFYKAGRLVESYVFRRSVCNIPTNSMNKTFATFSKGIRKEDGKYIESVIAAFLFLRSYRRFPSDDELMKEIQTRDLYNFRSRSYWLRRMENHDRKERVSVDEYTIEHIMPQNENLSDIWKKELGNNWEQIHSTYLHTLGNLTLTGYNPELSDRPFSEKKSMKGGFAESPLRMNAGLKVVDQWNETAIRERADRLAQKAKEVWVGVKLEPEILKTYQPVRTLTTYSIKDHLYIYNGPMKTIFEEFRKQVLALDPCVTEEFLKLYVAYKAETNFVDVVPQANRLRLSLNMKFHEINDPSKICLDVTDLGRWGNGDIEVGLSKIEDLPYVMGLVRQSFEKQMESE